MIHFITGRSASGKSYAIYKDIKESINQGFTKNILLVPEQFTLQAEADLITKMNLPGLLDVEVISFRRLAYRIVNETGGAKKKSINQTGKIMLLRKIFEEHSEQLQAFQSSYKEEGFIRHFCDLLDECKKNNLSADSLQAALSAPECGQILHNKIADLLLIAQKMEQVQQGIFLDEEDQLLLVTNQIQDSAWLEGARVWIDGFHSFSVLEYKVIEKIMQKAQQVTMALTLDHSGMSKDYELFEVPQHTFEKIKQFAGLHEISYKTTVCHGRYSSPVISHAEKNFYSFPYQTYKKDQEDLRLFSALHPYLEVRKMAADMITLARDHNYRWQDMAVITNDLDTYSPIIRRVFAEYMIPVFTDEKKDIQSNPLIVYISTLIKIVMYDYRYEDVFAHIKTGLTDLLPEQAEELENYALEYGIKGYAWKKEAPDSQLEEYRNILMAPLEKTAKKMKKNNTALQFSKELFFYLEQSKIPEKIEILIEQLKEEGQLAIADEYSQIWNIVMELLDQIVELNGDQTLSISEYLTILETGFSEHKLGMIPPTMDQVLLGNLERSKSHDIKALFLLGANEGIIPRAFEDKGILGDDEKVMLQHLGLEMTSDFSHKAKAEKFLIYSMISKPSEKLYIYFSISNLEGKSLLPSPLVDLFKKIFALPTESERSPENAQITRYVTTPGAAFNDLLENLRKDIDYGTMDPDWWTVYQWYRTQESWSEKCRLLQQGLFYNMQEPLLPADVSGMIPSNNHKFSISRFETYSQCPFKHFVSYGLHPVPRKEFELRMPDLGTLYHDAIELFSRKIEQEKSSWNKTTVEQAEQMIESIITTMSSEFQNGIFESSSRTGYMKEKVKRVGKRAIAVLTRQLQSGQFMPFEYEVAFSGKEEDNASMPALVINTLGGHRITIEGRIDRLDICKINEQTYFRVIDYKSGKKTFSPSDLYHRIELQLIVYLWAAFEGAAELIGTSADPAGAFYFTIDDPYIETDDTDPVAIAQMLEKEMQMKGLVLADTDVAEAMDSQISTTGKSAVIPLSVNKDGSISQTGSAFSSSDIQAFIAYAKESAAVIAEEIIRGNIRIEPYKKGSFISCSYCDYDAICQFDQRFEDHNCRYIHSLSKKEAIAIITKEKAGETDGLD